MKTLNATEAKREFSELLINAQRAPIGINKNGKPVAVIISSTEYSELQAMKENQLKAAIQKGMDDLDKGRVSDGQAVLKQLRSTLT